MDDIHVTPAGLPDRLTIHEAADFVVKETGKPRDYVISFLTDCAEQGHFSADVRPSSDYANVTHISRVDPTKSTISTAELIEWLDAEIEEAHQRAREAIAAKESRKWGYPVDPTTVRVHLAASWSKRLDSIAEDDTVSMSPSSWVEHFAMDIADRQQWATTEREAKVPTVRAEYLNLFGQLSATLPLRQELTGIRWAGEKLPNDWLTRFHISKPDLREWATSYAPEIAQSRILAERSADYATDSPKPNWNVWRWKQKATLREAVCLSCDTDPRTVVIGPVEQWFGKVAAQLTSLSAASDAVCRDISDKLEIARSYTGIGGTLSTVTEDKEVYVHLATFAEWAVSAMKWAVPDELRALAATAQPAADDKEESDDANTPDIDSRVAWKEAVKKQKDLMLQAHDGKWPTAKNALAWFKENDRDGTFKRGGGSDEFLWIGADGRKTYTGTLKVFQNFYSELKKMQ